MTISDLNHLTAVSETSSLVSGGKRKVSPYITQYNKAIVIQKAIASSSAFAYGGNAYATSVAINNADVDQDNS